MNTTTEENQIIPVIDLTPERQVELFSKPAAVDELIAAVREQVMAIVPDVTTHKGREAIRKSAAEVRRIRKQCEDFGKSKIAEERKAYEARVEFTRQSVKKLEKLNEVAEEIRAPLTRYEEEQAELLRRIEERKATLQGWLQLQHSNGVALTVAELESRLTEMEQFKPEVAEEDAMLNSAVSVVKNQIQQIKKAEQEAIELADLKAKQALQDKVASFSGLNAEGKLLPVNKIRDMITEISALPTDDPHLARSITERKFLLDAQLKEAIHQSEEEERRRMDQRAAEVQQLIMAVESEVDLYRAEDALLSLGDRDVERFKRLNEMFVVQKNKITERKKQQEFLSDADRIIAAVKKGAIDLADELLNALDARAKSEDEKQIVADLQIQISRKREEIEAQRKAEIEAEIKAKADAEAAEQRKREEDKAHAAKIHRQAAADIEALNVDADTAKLVVIAIATGKIRRVSIHY